MSHVLAAPPPEAAADWTVPQHWERFTAADHARWRTLFDRQMRLLPGRAAPAFLDGLAKLDLADGVPDFRRLSERLTRLTGWQVVAVPGLVPDEIFFAHLARRRFVAGNFLRDERQMDYLEEPDVFHDVFGHVPMLAHPGFANYMQAYGEGGLRSIGFGALDKLARLYWYTVEFGLVETAEGLRIYGAGIVSSAGESRFALESPSPNRLGFDLVRVMRTRYRIDAFQQTYFVIPSFEALLAATLETDFAPLYAELAVRPDLAISAVLPEDRVFTRGTQAEAAPHAA